MSTEGTFLNQDMRTKAIGVEGAPSVLEVEKGAIVRFAQAVEDPNPLWNDDKVARETRYGGLVAPPTFLRSVGVDRPELPFEVPFDRMLDGGSDWEYFEPVRVGDRITAVARITDVSERSGRLGTMLMTVIEITYTNQFGQKVATQQGTTIRY